MSKWVKHWDVCGSSGNVWVVSQDTEGNYGCSCPVWKFHRKECKHIDSVKSGMYGDGANYREALVGNVGQVTIVGDRVLYPLVPFNDGADLRATIIYDMIRANVSPEQIRNYKEKMLGKVSMTQIKEHVETKGRFVYSEFVLNRGWTKPVYTSHDLPLPTLQPDEEGVHA